MSETKWRECDDPEVLAAAVAAGVEVQCVAVDGRTWETGCDDSASFRRCMANDCRYRLPADWRPTPEPPADDLRERIARAIWEDDESAKRDGSDDWDAKPPTDHEVYLANADAVLAVLPPPPDVAMHDGEPVEQWRYDALVAERDWLAARLDEADAERTKLRHKLVESMPPVPPWPGAVLSGLTDEDGEPTWLALAPNVLGEAVRTCVDFPWFICGSDNAVTPYWVEVRAPRAPETERVQAWEAVRDGRLVVGASAPFEAHYIWRSGPGRAFIGERTMDKAVLVAPDGTVEVLRRDGES